MNSCWFLTRTKVTLSASCWYFGYAREVQSESVTSPPLTITDIFGHMLSRQSVTSVEVYSRECIALKNTTLEQTQ